MNSRVIFPNDFLLYEHIPSLNSLFMVGDENMNKFFSSKFPKRKKEQIILYVPQKCIPKILSK